VRHNVLLAQIGAEPFQAYLGVDLLFKPPNHGGQRSDLIMRRAPAQIALAQDLQGRFIIHLRRRAAKRRPGMWRIGSEQRSGSRDCDSLRGLQRRRRLRLVAAEDVRDKAAAAPIAANDQAQVRREIQAPDVALGLVPPGRLAGDRGSHKSPRFDAGTGAHARLIRG
jgi:hypothetical protein